MDKLKESWKNEFQNTIDELQKNDFALALLTIKKAKDYWKQVQPPGDFARQPEVFREQLSLEIGRFYSEQSNNYKYHILIFLSTLYELVYQNQKN